MNLIRNEEGKLISVTFFCTKSNMEKFHKNKCFVLYYLFKLRILFSSTIVNKRNNCCEEKDIFFVYIYLFIYL